MVRLISREEVYYKSSLVDHCISELQQLTYNRQGYNLNLNFNVGETETKGEDPYDHIKPFHHDRVILNDGSIISSGGKRRSDYLTYRSMAYIRFFELVNIQQLYFMDELKYDLVSFPFNPLEKRDAFKSIVNRATYSEALELDIAELSTLLPLVHQAARHSIPIIWFFSANNQVPFTAFLCDDGNFHSRFPSEDRDKLMSAASKAGLITGGLEVCRPGFPLEAI